MTWRPASATDAEWLRDLERAANLAALGHVFPPEQHPFPSEGVLARWMTLLAAPDVAVEGADSGSRLDSFVAYDTEVIRHLAVHPDRWGAGLARAAVFRAVDVIRAGGRTPRLWCLADNHRDNHRGSGLYAHLGWQLTGASRAAEWPPYPMELEHALRESRT